MSRMISEDGTLIENVVDDNNIGNISPQNAPAQVVPIGASNPRPMNSLNEINKQTATQAGF
jgi:hypothetical protein